MARVAIGSDGHTDYARGVYALGRAGSLVDEATANVTGAGSALPAPVMLFKPSQ